MEPQVDTEYNETDKHKNQGEQMLCSQNAVLRILSFQTKKSGRRRIDPLRSALGILFVYAFISTCVMTRILSSQGDDYVAHQSSIIDTLHHRHRNHVGRKAQVTLRGSSMAQGEGRSIVNLASLGYSSRPRVFGYYFEDDEPDDKREPSSHLFPNTHRRPMRLPVHWENSMIEIYPSKRQVPWTEEEEFWKKELGNSEWYNDADHVPLKPYANHTECQPMNSWQTESKPTCNSIHERDLGFLTYDTDYQALEQVRLLAHGYFRDVYMVKDSDFQTNVALKTGRWERIYDAYMMERHRMDAVVMDQLTRSPHVMDIYGFCGMGGLFEFADGGSLEDWIKVGEERLEGTEWSERILQYAMDVATAITDLHSHDSMYGHSSIVHGDIFSTQMVMSEGRYKLNDFNRCHFMYWNTTSNTESCPYHYLDYNAGPFRSPEEYEYGLQSEKIDVFSMGNIFYQLLEGKEPFDEMRKLKHVDDEYIQNLVKEGNRPQLSDDIINSDDPNILTILKAMSMCHTQDWRERASARKVRDVLNMQWRRVVDSKYHQSW